MTTISILEQDRIDAENFLEQFLTDSVGGDFRKGGALRDFAVGAMASIFAFFRKEVDYVKARQSLLLLGSLTGADVDNAVDEILSNWYITRKAGLYSRGMATLYLSQPVDISVPTTATFSTATGLVFKLDSTSPISFLAGELRPVYSSAGLVAYYTQQIPLISSDVGVIYNITPQAFTSFTAISPYLSRVETAQTFTGATDAETTTDMLNRAETAISTRNMISSRSIDATLRENFAEVNAVKVVGYGDSEMTRDFVEEASTRTRLHAGGAADVFLDAPVVQGNIANLVVGDIYTDPRPGTCILRDDSLIASATDFVAEGVVRGDILRTYNAMEHEADEYVVDQVTPLGLYVSRRSEFPGESPTALESFTDGVINGAALDSIESPAATYVFSNEDIGRYVRLKNCATASNIGIYQIRSIDTANNRAGLIDQAGVAVLVAESPIEWELIERELLLGASDGEILFDVGTGEFRINHLADHTFDANDAGLYGRIVHIWGSSNEYFNDIFYVSALEAVPVPTYAVLTSLTGAALPAADIALTAGFSLMFYEGITPDNFIERAGRTLVSYTVGANSPAYDDKVAAGGGGPRSSGRFTREIQEDGQVLLPQVPIYRIQSVSFVPNTPGSYGTLEVDGRVTFKYRSNTSPVDPAGDPNSLEYWVECVNPAESQSGWQVMKLHVGNAGNNFNGETLEVVYDTISGYNSVWGYMLSGDRRIVCGSVIPRGFHPVYISANIRYSRSRSAVENIEASEAAQALVDYIAGLTAPYELDASDMVGYLRSLYPNIGYVDMENIVINYELVAPDGRMIYYTTKNQVIVDPSKHRFPAEPLACLYDPLAVGVSNNTIKFLALPESIVLTETSL